MPGLNELLVKFQDPEEADPISKVQNQLNDAREELLESLGALLRRGEKLEDLTEVSFDFFIYLFIYLPLYFCFYSYYCHDFFDNYLHD